MKSLLLSTTIFIGLHLSAQQIVTRPDGSRFKQCIRFEETKPLIELAKLAQKEKPSADGKMVISPDEDLTPRKPGPLASSIPAVEDPVMQKEQGTQVMAGTKANFDGITNNVNSPLDPSGAASANYYVQMINNEYSVFDKSGNTLLPSTALTKLWPSNNILTDVVVMYDKFADRFVLSMLCWNSNKTIYNTIAMAVSKTNDPTGAFYTYTFVPDAIDKYDFPKFAVWSDGYYQSCNCHDNYEIIVYDRAKMLAGDNTAGYIVKDFSNITAQTSPTFPGSAWVQGGGGSFFCSMMLSADGALPPFGSPNYLFFFNDDNWGYGGPDEIVIYKVTTDWNTKTISMVLDNTLATQSFNSTFTNNRVDQPGKSQSLHSLDGLFAYRVPYMKFVNYNAAVCCNVVNTGSGIAGIRWYELHQDATSKVWSIYQQGTYAPSGGSVHRWNPSIAMDNQGNIGLAYAVSASSSVYPGIRYTGRLASDPLGTMTFTETTAIAGLSTFTLDYRWGDYSHTSLDPDGLTFWHTNMYMLAGGNRGTRIFSFQIGTPSGIAEQTANQPELTAYQAGDGFIVKASKLPSNEHMSVDLFTAEGKQVSSKILVPVSNSIETTFDGSSLAKGIYLVRVGNNTFQKVIKVSVQTVQ